jgi:hypothetical protein
MPWVAAAMLRCASAPASGCRPRDSFVLFATPALVCGLEAPFRTMGAAHRVAADLPRDLANLDTDIEVGLAHNHEAVELRPLRDHAAWWRRNLASRDAFRPIGPDRRLWAAEIATGAGSTS